MDLDKYVMHAYTITSSYKIALWHQNNPWAVPAQVPSFPSPHSIDLFTDSTALPLPECDRTGTDQMLSNRLLPLDNTHLRFPLSFCGFIDHFFFIAEYFPFVWKYCRLLILSPMKNQLGCFQFGTIKHKNTVTFCVKGFLLQISRIKAWVQLLNNMTKMFGLAQNYWVVLNVTAPPSIPSSVNDTLGSHPHQTWPMVFWVLSSLRGMQKTSCFCFYLKCPSNKWCKHFSVFYLPSVSLL